MVGNPPRKEVTMSDRDYIQAEPPVTEFEVIVSFTLERESTILTDEVINDNGVWCMSADADKWGAYDYANASITAMLDELVKYIDKELCHLRKFISSGAANKDECERHDLLTRMRNSARGWHIVEQNIEEI